MRIRYKLDCNKCGLSIFFYPIDPEDFRYCPECNSKQVEISDRTEIEDES